MTPQQHATRAVATAVLAVATLVAVSGCSVSAEPSPSPTPTATFSSEEEAFAAAEEVYRAYNEALNLHRSGDPTANPHEYLAGGVLESELSTTRDLEAQGIRIEGDTRLLSFTGLSSDVDSRVPSIEAQVCLDISEARAIDSNDQDVTPPERKDTYGLIVTITGTPGRMLISDYRTSEDLKC